jgi:hypothetical protein
LFVFATVIIWSTTDGNELERAFAQGLVIAAVPMFGLCAGAAYAVARGKPFAQAFGYVVTVLLMTLSAIAASPELGVSVSRWLCGSVAAGCIALFLLLLLARPTRSRGQGSTVIPTAPEGASVAAVRD